MHRLKKQWTYLYEGMVMIFEYIYSDPHFGHKNIGRLADRPFIDTTTMDLNMISLYNNRIKESDTCLWLGDVSFWPKGHTEAIIKSLHGKKILIMGNHDEDRSAKWFSEIGFDAVFEHPITFMIKDVLFRASHYPYSYNKYDHAYHTCKVDYTKRRYGETLLHGHTHSKKKVCGKQINLCVEAWGYKPVNTGVIYEIAKGIIKAPPKI